MGNNTSNTNTNDRDNPINLERIVNEGSNNNQNNNIENQVI